MKQIINSLALVAAILSFAACNSIVEQPEVLAGPRSKVVLKAVREGLQPGTRVVRQDDGAVWWDKEEKISVFCGSGTDGGSEFVSTNTSIEELVEFEGDLQVSGDIWAVYPYSSENSFDGSSVTTVIPARQTAVEGNFSGGVFPAVAKGDTSGLWFRNICGGIKFSVSRSDIESVTVKGNYGEALAGKVKVAINADGQPVVTEVIESEPQVTLVAPFGETFKPGVYYYITLLPAELPEGITITADTPVSTGFVRSDKPQTVKRSVFGVLDNVDTYIVDEYEPEWVTSPFRHQSLLMRFTATWCGWCPRMNKSVAKAQELYPGKIQHLAVHGSGSSLVFSSANTLMTQYKINGFPTGICDGRKEINNSSISVTARNIVNAAKETESTYGTVSGARIATTLEGKQLDINMRLFFKAPGDYLVTVILVEDGVIAGQEDYEDEYHESYVHDNIARKAVTAVKGNAFTQTGDFSTKDFNWSVTLSNNWSVPNLRVLAYVQAAYGDREKIASANYGDYYVDNCFTVKAGETLELELE